MEWKVAKRMQQTGNSETFAERQNNNWMDILKLADKIYKG